MSIGKVGFDVEGIGDAAAVLLLGGSYEGDFTVEYRAAFRAFREEFKYQVTLDEDEGMAAFQAAACLSLEQHNI
ncbi:MAG: hypothetical protein K2N09_09040 [Muribaculaceae bacterium]|nr:hypothetical protein [Muribaculaceae bacterium]